jgi:hypothetical protein
VVLTVHSFICTGGAAQRWAGGRKLSGETYNGHPLLENMKSLNPPFVMAAGEALEHREHGRVLGVRFYQLSSPSERGGLDNSFKMHILKRPDATAPLTSPLLPISTGVGVSLAIECSPRPITVSIVRHRLLLVIP